VTVELFWLPLGAGGRSVRLNGRVFEACSAWHEHRPRCDLYHSALVVGSYAIEMAPVWNDRAADRGVVAEGPVGSRRLGRWRLFRYGIRCRPDGRIPDIDEAVDSPRRLSDDPAVARAILGLAPAVPTLVWGRDELRVGDMWNSNSVIAWLLARSGLDAGAIRPPAAGRAPGWVAGVRAAGFPQPDGRLLRTAGNRAALSVTVCRPTCSSPAAAPPASRPRCDSITSPPAT